MDKKKVLWISEASFLNTGFSTLSKEILKRLYDTGKYEIAEYGSYAVANDPRQYELPWKFYSSIPDKEDTYWYNRYESNIYGQFGATLFEKVCLDFVPDCCVDTRDNWMSAEWTLKSPFRKYFKYLIGPTVDGSPQKKEWLEDYKNCDLVFTYSNYGKRVLEEESGGKINVFDVFAPGVNHDIFKALDKQKLRQQFDILADANIILTVMRNQKRKLFPELIHMFAKLLQEYLNDGKTELYNKTYLHLHTSYPDVGYDIGRHILESGVGHRILVTYCCQNCKQFYVDRFQSEVTACKFCGVVASHMPNTSHGITREQLAVIYNLADLYVQYSICEGLSLTVAEAKACEVPACGLDNTAVSEQVNAPGCFPIKNGQTFHESVLETEQIRFLPDNKDAIKKIKRFFELPKEVRIKMGKEARKHAIEGFSMDRAAKVVENAIDSVDILDRNTTWFNPKPRLAPLNRNFKKAETVSEFVDLCILSILGDPSLLNSYWRNELVKGLSVGFLITRNGRENFDFNKCLNMMMNIGQNQNNWEQVRVNTFFGKEKKEILWEMI